MKRLKKENPDEAHDPKDRMDRPIGHEREEDHDRAGDATGVHRLEIAELVFERVNRDVGRTEVVADRSQKHPSRIFVVTRSLPDENERRNQAIASATTFRSVWTGGASDRDVPENFRSDCTGVSAYAEVC